MDLEKYKTSPDYRSGYEAGDYERIALANQNDAFRHELRCMESLLGEAIDNADRVQAAVDRWCLALLPLSISGTQADMDELRDAIKEARREQ